MEHEIPAEKWGIKLVEIGPWQIDEEKWQLSYIPVPTDQCTLCAERVEKGKKPACVHNCQHDVMRYGTVTELAKEMGKKSHMVMFTPK